MHLGQFRSKESKQQKWEACAWGYYTWGKSKKQKTWEACAWGYCTWGNSNQRKKRHEEHAPGAAAPGAIQTKEIKEEKWEACT